MYRVVRDERGAPSLRSGNHRRCSTTAHCRTRRDRACRPSGSADRGRRNARLVVLARAGSTQACWRDRCRQGRPLERRSLGANGVPNCRRQPLLRPDRDPVAEPERGGRWYGVRDAHTWARSPVTHISDLALGRLPRLRSRPELSGQHCRSSCPTGRNSRHRPHQRKGRSRLRVRRPQELRRQHSLLRRSAPLSHRCACPDPTRHQRSTAGTVDTSHVQAAWPHWSLWLKLMPPLVFAPTSSSKPRRATFALFGTFRDGGSSRVKGSVKSCALGAPLR